MREIDGIYTQGLSPEERDMLKEIKRPQLLADIGESLTAKPDKYLPEKQYFPLREMD